MSDQEPGGMDRFFTEFSNQVAKWTGSHSTFAIVTVLVVVSLIAISVEDREPPDG